MFVCVIAKHWEYHKKSRKKMHSDYHSSNKHEIKFGEPHHISLVWFERKDEWIPGEHTEAQCHACCLLTKVWYLNVHLYVPRKS